MDTQIDKMVSRLVGCWHGRGAATYPTIAPTTYLETTEFIEHDSEILLRVNTRTWRLSESLAPSPLHFEYGFIRLDGSDLTYTNAQSNGRTEVLLGALQVSPESLTLVWESVAFSNDPRMVSSRRQIEVRGSLMNYKMFMTTQTVQTLSPHLKASLFRQ